MPGAADALRLRIFRALLWRQAPLLPALGVPWLLVAWARPQQGGWALAGACGCALVLALLCWRLRQRVARDALHWLDAAVPALEDSSVLLEVTAAPLPGLAGLQRQRLLARAAEVLHSDAPDRIARAQPPGSVGWLLLASAAGALLLAAWPHRPAADLVAGLQATPTSAVPAAKAPRLQLRVAPPAYTGVAATMAPPQDLQVPEQSHVQWCLQPPPAAAAAERIELSDGTRLAPDAAGCASWTAGESVLWRWRDLRHTLRVRADQPPQVSVELPAEPLLVLPAGTTSAQIAVTVRDDYRIAQATLHLTLARGNGENVRFSDRELPLPASPDPRLRSWRKTWTLAELGMAPGDELYFFVRASDTALPRPHTSTSATYTLRLPGAVAEGVASSALPTLVPPESLRSQRQVIIDTEQLLADMRAPLARAQLQARSESIAGDQAQLRRRYGQFLGEESSLFGDDHEHGDEHVSAAGAAGGAAGATDLAARFGHAHDQAENATLYDDATKTVLRRVLAAMWEAEKSLRALAPKPALPSEYRALDAIKQLQQAERIYLHRTAFAPPPLKEDKRLTGDVLGAASSRRVQASAPDAAPAALGDLVLQLGSDGPLPALWSATARDWIRQRLPTDDDRLAAQRAVQDVQDGCVPCRGVLRAWLRSGLTGAPPRLVPAQAAATPYARAWAQAAGR